MIDNKNNSIAGLSNKAHGHLHFQQIIQVRQYKSCNDNCYDDCYYYYQCCFG